MERIGPGGRVGRPRNSQVDRKFIGEAARAGEMRVDPELGLLVWSGRQDDIGHAGQMPPPERQCNKSRPVRDDDGNDVLDSDKKPLRRRCPKWAVRNGAMCPEHIGGLTGVQQAAREQAVASSQAAVAALVSLALDEKVHPRDRVAALNSVLDRAGVRGGIDVTVDSKPWQEMLKNLVGEQAENDGEE